MQRPGIKIQSNRTGIYINKFKENKRKWKIGNVMLIQMDRSLCDINECELTSLPISKNTVLLSYPTLPRV